MKVYLSDQLASSVNDVKCGYAIVSEFMNEVKILMIKVYLILLYLESLVLSLICSPIL